MSNESSHVLNLLDSRDGVSYQRVTDIKTVREPTSCSVKGCVIRNIDTDNELLHVLIPAHHLLSLNSVCTLLGGQYEALHSDALAQLLSTESLTSVPSVPRWENIPCLIDSAIFMFDHLLLDPGNDLELLSLDNSSFHDLAGHSMRAEISEPVPALNTDASDDELNIRNSVNQFTERRIKQRLQDTLEMPPIPRTTEKIIALRSQPEPDIDALVGAVEIDPALAAQVVSWASSSYYGAPGTIKSIHDAIVRVLGFDMVLNMTLGLTLSKGVTLKTLTPSEIQEYWREAVLIACTCEALVRAIPAKQRPERGLAYLSGLLSNFGTLVMSEVFPMYHQQVKRVHGVNMHRSRSEVEIYALGICGQQIASWLLAEWSMPATVCEGIRESAYADLDTHHNTYARLIQLSQALLKQRGLLSAPKSLSAETLMSGLQVDADKAEDALDKICALEAEFIGFSQTLAR